MGARWRRVPAGTRRPRGRPADARRRPSRAPERTSPASRWRRHRGVTGTALGRSWDIAGPAPGPAVPSARPSRANATAGPSANLTPWSDPVSAEARVVRTPRERNLARGGPSASPWHPPRARHPCPHPTPPRSCGATAPTPTSGRGRPCSSATGLDPRRALRGEPGFAALLRERCVPTARPTSACSSTTPPSTSFCLVGAGLVGRGGGRPQPHPARRAPARDIAYTDVQLLVTEPRHQELLAPVAGDLDLPGGLLVSSRFADADDPARPALGESARPPPWTTSADRRAGDPRRSSPTSETLWVLLFTSGTSAAPKAVRCTQRRLLTTGNRMTMVLDVGPDDVGYLAMPLFHSNSLMVGLAPALVAGASVGLARRFSASRFLDDVRRYGATWFNYTGKPLAYLLATPERPDDADNPLRLAYGNEGSPHVVEAVAKRFGVAVVDVFGSTEGGIALDRSGGLPRGSVGKLRQGIKVVDPDGNERPRGRVRRRRPARERRGVRGRDRQRRRRGPVRGLLPQRRGHGPHHPQRLVLERRPRLRRRRRLGVLRRAHLGLAPGGRRELPGRARSRPSWPAIPTSCWRRSTACPTSTPATRSWWRWCCATAPCFDPVGLRRLGRRPDAT